MNLDKYFIKYTYFFMVITFVTSALVISSNTELSFAKIDNENKDNNDKDLEDVSSSLVDRNKKTLNDDLKEPVIQNDILNDQYPNQFYICGYPQQIITDYNSFEKINCT
jgi:hypothetical protein